MSKSPRDRFDWEVDDLEWKDPKAEEKKPKKESVENEQEWTPLPQTSEDPTR